MTSLFCRRPLAFLWISSATTTTSFLPSIRAFSVLVVQRQQQHQRSLLLSQRASPISAGSWKRAIMASSSTTAASATDENESSVLRVALCQFHVGADKSANLQTAADFIDRAAVEHQARLIVLPEIWNSPYATAAFESYAEVIPSLAAAAGITKGESVASTATTGQELQVTSPSVDLIRSKALQHGVWIVGGSIPERDDATNQLFNTCVVYSPSGDMVAKHRKVHLFDIDIPNGITFLESDTLSAGSTVSSFETPWCNIGVGICYDIRFAEYAMLLAQSPQHHCRVLIYPGAFNLITGEAHWELLARSRAVDNQCYVVTASPARSAAPTETDPSTVPYPHYTAWGHSTIVAPWGNILATTDEGAAIVVADLDLSKVDEMRRNIPIRSQKRLDLYKLEQV